MEIVIGYQSISVYTERAEIRNYIIERTKVIGLEIPYQDTDGFVISGNQAEMYSFLADVCIKYSNCDKIE